MASRGDQPQGGQTAPEQPLPTQSGAPPWPGPGPDTDWWHGGRTDPSDALAPVSPAPAQPATPARSVARRVRPPRPTRRPGSGLVALVGLPGRRARLRALALSLAGPLLLAAGMLAATW